MNQVYHADITLADMDIESYGRSKRHNNSLLCIRAWLSAIWIASPKDNIFIKNSVLADASRLRCI